MGRKALAGIFVLAIAASGLTAASAAGDEASELYTQKGTDPSFKSLLNDGTIPTGHNSNKGVKGSTIDVHSAAMIFVTGATFK